MNKKLLEMSGEIYKITEDLTLDEMKDIFKDVYNAKRYWTNRNNID